MYFLAFSFLNSKQFEARLNFQIHIEWRKPCCSQKFCCPAVSKPHLLLPQLPGPCPWSCVLLRSFFLVAVHQSMLEPSLPIPASSGGQLLWQGGRVSPCSPSGWLIGEAEKSWAATFPASYKAPISNLEIYFASK